MTALAENGDGRALEQLDGPELPDEAYELYHDIWIPLHCARGSTGFGPSLLAHGEILAFCQLHGLTLEAWELSAIRQLDLAFMAFAAARNAA